MSVASDSSHEKAPIGGALPPLSPAYEKSHLRKSDDPEDPDRTAAPSPTDLRHSHNGTFQEPAFSGGQDVDRVITAEDLDAKRLTFPEGGAEAWGVIAGAWVCSFVTWGYANAWGVFQDYYLHNTLSDKSASTVAWISSLQYFLIFFIGVLTGRLFDMGLFRPTMTVGMVLWVFSQMMTSLCTEYYQLVLAQGIGMGLSFGIIFPLSVAVPAQWFNRRRAFAFGILATGSSVGGVIFPIMAQRLLPKIGFGWTMRVIGFMCLGLLIFAWFAMRTRLPPSVDIRTQGWRNVKFVDGSAFKVPSYSFFVLGSLLVLFGLYTPFTYIDLWTGAYDIPGSGYWLCVMNGASAFGRIIPGALADRSGRINMLLPNLYLCAILVFIFPLCTKLGGIIVFTMLYGFASGCYVSLIPAAIAQLGSTETIGTRLGMMFGVMSVGGLVGTPIAGAILGSGNDLHWWPALCYAGALMLAGCMSITVARQFALGRLDVRGKI
ncbi:unnamed protein product [Parajaminaea phylloscopi]